MAGDKSLPREIDGLTKQRFKAYPISYFHIDIDIDIDIAEVRTK